MPDRGFTHAAPEPPRRPAPAQKKFVAVLDSNEKEAEDPGERLAIHAANQGALFTKKECPVGPCFRSALTSAPSLAEARDSEAGVSSAHGLRQITSR